MAGYIPLKITGMSTGLIQEREDFLLPAMPFMVPLQRAQPKAEQCSLKRPLERGAAKRLNSELQGWPHDGCARFSEAAPGGRAQAPPAPLRRRPACPSCSDC